MVTIIQNYLGEAGGAEQRARGREGWGRKGRRDKNAPEKNAGPAVTCGLWFQAARRVTSELQATIHLIQAHDNIVRKQELKYSAGRRPSGRGGMAQERPREREGTRGEPGLVRGPPPATLATLLHLRGCRSRLLAMGDWHLLC